MGVLELDFVSPILLGLLVGGCGAPLQEASVSPSHPVVARETPHVPRSAPAVRTRALKFKSSIYVYKGVRSQEFGDDPVAELEPIASQCDAHARSHPSPAFSSDAWYMRAARVDSNVSRYRLVELNGIPNELEGEDYALLFRDDTLMRGRLTWYGCTVRVVYTAYFDGPCAYLVKAMVGYYTHSVSGVFAEVHNELYFLRDDQLERMVVDGRDIARNDDAFTDAASRIPLIAARIFFDKPPERSQFTR